MSFGEAGEDDLAVEVCQRERKRGQKSVEHLNIESWSEKLSSIRSVGDPEEPRREEWGEVVWTIGERLQYDTESFSAHEEGDVAKD